MLSAVWSPINFNETLGWGAYISALLEFESLYSNFRFEERVWNSGYTESSTVLKKLKNLERPAERAVTPDELLQTPWGSRAIGKKERKNQVMCLKIVIRHRIWWFMKREVWLKRFGLKCDWHSSLLYEWASKNLISVVIDCKCLKIICVYWGFWYILLFTIQWREPAQ